MDKKIPTRNCDKCKESKPASAFGDADAKTCVICIRKAKKGKK